MFCLCLVRVLLRFGSVLVLCLCKSWCCACWHCWFFWLFVSGVVASVSFGVLVAC